MTERKRADVREAASGPSPATSVVGEVTLAASTQSVPVARHLVRRLLRGTPLAERVDDAVLATTELATNAVVHGRAPIVVRVEVRDDVLRVEIHDGSDVSPALSMLQATAITGRGLVLIGAVADDWGVTPNTPDQGPGKTVWFELHRHGRGAADTDALLASWADELDGDPAREKVRLVLTDMDTHRMAAAEAHVEGVLRELTLAAGDDGAGGDGMSRQAEALRAAAAGVEQTRVDIKRQLALAVAAGQPHVDIEVTMRREEGAALRAYGSALEEADRLSRQGELLSMPVLRDLSDYRQSYLHRLLQQLSS